MSGSATVDTPAEESTRPAAGRVAAAAATMVGAILLSRVLALVRDMVVSYFFGASMVTDAYKAAFTLPDLFYYLIAGGALSSAFIPVFTEYLTRGDEENAWRVFSIFGTFLAAALAVVVLVGEAFAPALLRPLVPGFSDEKLALTAALTRIIFPAQLFFFAGGLMMSTLYARGHFLMPALGPVIYNLGIIAGGVAGGSLFGSIQGIYGLAWGVLAGAFVGNVAMQVWAMRRLGVRYHPSLDLRHPGVVRVARLMLPVLLGLSLPQLCVILSRPFASGLGDGPITWLDNANKLMQMPLGVFAQGVSVAIFPTLSMLAARGDLEGLRSHFSLGLRAILFLTLPCAALLIVLAVPVTAVIFQRGRWSWGDTEATAAATLCYSLQNTVTPMIAGTAATAGFVALCWMLAGPPSFGAGSTPAVPYGEQVARSQALAISYSVAMILYLAALLALLRRALGGLGGREIAGSVARVAAAAAAAGAAAWSGRVLLDGWFKAYGPQGTNTLLGLVEIGVCTALAGAVYILLVRRLRVPEAEYVYRHLSARFPGRFRSGVSAEAGTTG